MSKENILITARYLPHGLCVILLRSGFSNGLEFPLLEEYRNSLLIRKRDLQTNKQVCNTDWIEHASGRDAPCDQNHLIPEKPRSAAVAFAALCFISGSIHQLLSEQHGTWHCSGLRAWTFFPPNPGEKLPSTASQQPSHWAQTLPERTAYCTCWDSAAECARDLMGTDRRKLCWHP